MSTLRIAFLGPFGTFTEQALRQVAPKEAELIPLTSPPLAMSSNSCIYVINIFIYDIKNKLAENTI